MKTNPHENNSGRSDEREDILRQIERHLHAFDVQENDLATEEDVIILRCLLEAVRAARRKGYSEELLVQVLRSLVHTPPTL